MGKEIENLIDLELKMVEDKKKILCSLKHEFDTKNKINSLNEAQQKELLKRCIIKLETTIETMSYVNKEILEIKLSLN